MVLLLKKPLTFAVIGGDMRQAKLAEMLYADGHYIYTYALEKAEMLPSVIKKSDLQQALYPADCVILPLPISGKAGFVNTPVSKEICSLDEVFKSLRPNQLVCAGIVDEECRKKAQSYGLSIIDYYAREELMIANAVCTSEGAIAIAMDNTAITLCSAKILIIGFGRIGKVLSNSLHMLGADVYVSARSHADRAWIKAYGCKPLNTYALTGLLSDFDIIINTVPATVIDENLLREVKRSCLLLDLASKPGGIDFSAAAGLGLHAIWALSLPGEAAPITSGASIRDTIYNILHEEEEKVEQC
jgi:dipicolinate synthase subunit A